MNEQKLAKEFEEYRKLAQTDKKIDVASLMINALQKHQDNSLSSKEKKWAYLVSMLLPPFGLIFAVKFYMSDKEDGEQAAWTCAFLTAVAVLVLVLFIKLFSGAAGVNLKQIQQIKPSDIQNITQ